MQEKSEIFILGPPKILIFGESVEQGVVLYKCRARSRTSLCLSECSIFPIGILSVLSRGYYLCNTYTKIFYFSGTKNPLHFLLAQGMKRFLTNKFFIPLERGFLPFASCIGAFLR